MNQDLGFQNSNPNRFLKKLLSSRLISGAEGSDCGSLIMGGLPGYRPLSNKGKSSEIKEERTFECHYFFAFVTRGQ